MPYDWDEITGGIADSINQAAEMQKHRNEIELMMFQNSLKNQKKDELSVSDFRGLWGDIEEGKDYSGSGFNPGEEVQRMYDARLKYQQVQTQETMAREEEKQAKEEEKRVKAEEAKAKVKEEEKKRSDKLQEFFLKELFKPADPFGGGARNKAKPLEKATQAEAQPSQQQYEIGQVIDTPKGKYKIVGFDTDGEPLVEVSK